MFEICAEVEDRNVWALLLRLEHFEEALSACDKNRPSQRQRVLAAHADWLFRKGRLVESAKKFAEATTVPFEHVALRFLRVDQKAALQEYFRCRLKQCKPEDRVKRALLGVWAVEIALANLNNLRIAATEEMSGKHLPVSEKWRARHVSALEEARGTLRELLRECKDLDVHTTIYHLLQSHGWLEELTHFAEERRDFDTVILHRVSRCDYAGAIKNLEKFQEKAAANVGHLVCRFAAVLFGAEPQAFVSLLLRKEFSGVDPLSVLPALYTPRASPTHRLEVVRYLEHVIRNFPALVGHSADGEAGGIRAAALGDDRDLMGGDSLEDGTPAPTGRSWATCTAVLNALTVMYTCKLECADKPDQLDGADAEKLLLISSARRKAIRFSIHSSRCAFVSKEG